MNTKICIFGKSTPEKKRGQVRNQTCPVFYGLSPFESISNDLLKSNLNYGAETKWGTYGCMHEGTLAKLNAPNA